MRVLMVQAPSVEGFTQEKVYPIGIVTLATHLIKAGHEADLLDMNIECDSFGALKERLLSCRPEVVGISLRNIDPLANKTSSLIPPFVTAVRLVKAVWPQARIVAGGTGFSLFPERIMEELPEIDYGIVGEAEKSFPLLLDAFDDPPSLPGLCQRKEGKVLINPPAPDFDMAGYLVPDRNLMPPKLYLDVNSYVSPFGIETKRGCPLNCAYCVYPKLQGSRLRFRQPKEVVDEIEVLCTEYGIKDFHFNDPVVNILSGHLETICEEILRRGLKITWTGFFREDLMEEDKVFLYEKSGCNCFSFSPDGMCQEALDILGKKLTVEDVLKAAKLAAQTDVVTMYHFMTNVPGENEETIKKGMDLLDRLYELHNPKRNLGTIVLNNIRILPGTPIEKIARREGVIGPETDLIYPVYYNPGPYETLRYRLETYHLCKNVFMWQKVRS